MRMKKKYEIHELHIIDRCFTCPFEGLKSIFTETEIYRTWWCNKLQKEICSAVKDRMTNEYYIKPTASTKQVLEKMQELHIDSMPVVDENKQWKFFANREEILARLMTTILLAKGE